MDYLVLGSRLGTEALRRDCFEGWHPDDIPSYFRQQNVTPLWRQLCDMLDKIDPASPRAAVILADVRAGFRFFAAAAREQESAGDLCFEE